MHRMGHYSRRDVSGVRPTWDPVTFQARTPPPCTVLTHTVLVGTESVIE